MRIVSTEQNIDTIPTIRQFPAESWAKESAELLLLQIKKCITRRGGCSVMLTGGRCASQLYATWTEHPDFQRLNGVNFFFGDERCVVPDHPESNYGMTMVTLFATGIPKGCKVHRIEADSADPEAAAVRYGVALPLSIDILLLGVGEDGHIASLFPHSVALRETQRRVVQVTGPKPPHQRLTITPPVISRAKSSFVLAAGATKVAVLDEAQRVPDDIGALPARLVLGGTWLTDHDTTPSLNVDTLFARNPNA